MALKFTVKFKGEDLGLFDSDEVTMNQALTLEGETGMTMSEMITALGKNSARGLQAVVWFRYLCLGRPQPLHNDFKFGDFDVEMVEDAEEPADPTPAADPVAELEAAFKKPATSGSAR